MTNKLGVWAITADAGMTPPIRLKWHTPKTVTVSRGGQFSARVETGYRENGDLAAFAVQFFHDTVPVYVREDDLLGGESDPVFRFFDWKDPVWTQIRGNAIPRTRKQYGHVWYTHDFIFTIGADIAGIDYFGLRLKKGMFTCADQDNGVWVLCDGVAQQMSFDTPYFILNPKDLLHEVVQIRQDIWMPLLVSAYTLGSAIERHGRPYFSDAIEKIHGWFHFALGQRQRDADEAPWDKTAAQKLLLAEMIKELWEKGPRRLVAFYSGMGYVFGKLGLADMAADVIYEFFAALTLGEDRKQKCDINDVSPRLFAVMLLLGLRTEKARLYVTIDLTTLHPQETYTIRGLRELIETKTLMTLFFAHQGQRYAPIKIPKPFDLNWGAMEQQSGSPGILSIELDYKKEMALVLTFTPRGEDGRYAISLMRTQDRDKREWLGRIILIHDKATRAVRFITESMTSNFRHLRDINAFKYILLIAGLQYSVHVLQADSKEIVFMADFFDHCAPYDLILLQHFGWMPSDYDKADYDLTGVTVSQYSGRAMTLPIARIPLRKKNLAALSIYLLGPGDATVAVDKALYEAFVAQIDQWSGWHTSAKEQTDVLIDGVPYRLASESRFRQTFCEAFHHVGLGLDLRLIR